MNDDEQQLKQRIEAEIRSLDALAEQVHPGILDVIAAYGLVADASRATDDYLVGLEETGSTLTSDCCVA